MRSILKPEQLEETLGSLTAANNIHDSKYSGARPDQQPVHTVYGGAHLFTADTIRKMGQVALLQFQEYAPDFIEFAHALRLPGSGSLATSGEIKTALLRAADRNVNSLKTGHTGAWLAATVYNRVVNKLRLQPVEDFRIDFENGFGVRSDEEEDQEALRVAEEVANCVHEGALPPFIGLRIKPFSNDLFHRSVRTLDLFMGAVLNSTRGELPDNFVVTLPKVTIPAQVSALVRVLDLMEASASLPKGTIRIEITVATPTAVVGEGGRSVIQRLVQAANGRCRGVHLAVNDYLSSLEISAPSQSMSHTAADFARNVMLASLAGTGIWVSDGATHVVPIAPHRLDGPGRLSAEQVAQNQEAVHRAWRISFDDITRSLQNGFYQGWDVHPAQLSVRYAAVYAYFLKNLDSAAYRLTSFVEKGARASMAGEIFDDAATGQGLLNFFLRAVNCGAITIDEAAMSGLSMDELKSRSFDQIIKGRAGNPEPDQPAGGASPGGIKTGIASTGSS